MKKITIGLFNDSFFPKSDGVLMVVDNYARRLSKYANVIVFVPKYKKKFDDSALPYKVVRCKSLQINFIDYSLPLPDLDKKFKNILNDYHLDIVHIHSPFTMGSLGVRYAKRHNVPCIGTMHSQFKLDFYKYVHSERISSRLTDRLIKLFSKCDECWAVNKEVARIYHEEYGYPVMPRVMNNATEMIPVDNIEAANIINEKYGLTNDENVFLFVGRLNTLKNILFIVESLAKVREKNKELKFKMLFVGSGPDEEKLVNHIKKYNLEDNVIICGKVTDRYLLECYYNRAALFLFPSVYDASSLVQIEAASQKTPTIFLKNTATAATVTDNVNGFLSDYSVDAYADKIIEVMNDKELYSRVSSNAFKDLYVTWDDKVKEVYDLYLKIINDKK